MSRPKRVLMTVDSVGGVWRYAADLARALNRGGIACLLVGSGPDPRELAAPDLPDTELVWKDAPLDWMVEDEAVLDAVPAGLMSLARDWDADLLHLNLPTQAAGMARDLPVLTVSHSCVPTWWEAMRGRPLPDAWAWQLSRNRRGLDRADCVLAPSASHAASLRRVYGDIERLRVVHNATDATGAAVAGKEPFVLAAGRWWDEGKGGATLDRAARDAPWPVRMAGPVSGPNGEGVLLRHADMLGELPSRDLLALMDRAAIFASASAYEPFGLSVLEAGARGAALLLSDIPTFRELWEGAAIFAAPGDPNAFARAIALLADDAALRERLGAAASRIARRFTCERQFAGLLDGYAAAIAHHQASARGTC